MSDITERNGHEEFGPSEMVEVLETQVKSLENNLERTRENYQGRISRMQEEHTRSIDRYQARISELTSVEQGEAILRMEQAEAKAERAQEMISDYRGRAQQAESDKARALASVEGHADIHPEDPRVLHIWKKAHRIASSEGFCTEYDKIADALGIPDIEQEYSGEVTVVFNGTVTIPVSGFASRADIANGDIEPDIDTSDILENVDSYNVEWTIESYDITAE